MRLLNDDDDDDYVTCHWLSHGLQLAIIICIRRHFSKLILKKKKKKNQKVLKHMKVLLLRAERLRNIVFSYLSNLEKLVFSSLTLWHSAKFRQEYSSTLDVVHRRTQSRHYSARCKTCQLTTFHKLLHHSEVLVNQGRCNLVQRERQINLVSKMPPAKLYPF